jgi:hypothetical protein
MVNYSSTPRLHYSLKNLKYVIKFLVHFTQDFITEGLYPTPNPERKINENI